MKYRTTRENEILKKIGERVKFYRKKKGLTQAKFAEMLDVNRSTLARIEAGDLNSSILSLANIVEELDVTLCDLFNE